jgi:signal transduction histidine kinase
MMRSWPGSLVGQTTLLLLVGVLLSNLIALLVYAGERTDVLTATRGRQLAEQVTVAARLLEEAPPAGRRALARSFWQPGLRLFWDAQPLVAGGDDSRPVRGIRRAFEVELEPDRHTRLRLRIREPRGEEDRSSEQEPAAERGPRGRRMGRFAGGPVLVGALELGDGTWLNFMAPVAPFRSLWAAPFLPIAAGTTLLVSLVGIWAVRRAARPLATLAEAAERLGVDIDARPMAETGPIEVRRAARAFNRMQGRLQRFVRDRTQMLAAISHDLRTPLTRLRLRAELIEEPEQQRKFLADLDEMQALLEATLAFARDDATGEPVQRFDLAVLLQGCCDEWEDTGARTAYAGPAHLVWSGRPMGLKRAFANLIGNAVRYGGSADVALDPGAEAVVVTVDDRGPGLPEAELEKVFQPFYRLERSRSRETGGVGLGLAVVRTIVAGHGGDVRLDNRAEGGLRATVTLPAAGPPPALGPRPA